MAVPSLHLVNGAPQWFTFHSENDILSWPDDICIIVSSGQLLPSHFTSSLCGFPSVINKYVMVYIKASGSNALYASHKPQGRKRMLTNEADLS